MKPFLLFACMFLGILTAAAVMAHDSVFATPENWSEVATFTGLGSREVQNTTYFTVNHTEWRIRWEYAPDPNSVTAAAFIVSIYQHGETDSSAGTISAFGGLQTSGTAYIQNQTGTFYMSIRAGQPGILNYTIIVEQDLDSAPEFPPSTVLFLTFATTLLTTIVLAHWKQRRNTPREG